MKAKPLLFVFLIVSLALSLYVPNVKAQSTFGYEVKGTAGSTKSSFPALKTLFAVGEDGTVTKITVYVKNALAAVKAVDVGLYDGLGQETHLQQNVPSLHDNWYDFDVPDFEFTAGTFGLAVKNVGHSACEYFYDAGTSNQMQQDNLLSGDDLPDPFVVDAQEDREYSIYATYTPSAEEEKSFALSETITPTANVYEFKEKLFYGTETFGFADALVLLQEMVFSLDQNIQTVVTMTKTLEKAALIFAVLETIIITAQASMITEIIAAAVEVTTFGTLALVIAIIALAIGVTGLTAKKRL